MTLPTLPQARPLPAHNHFFGVALLWTLLTLPPSSSICAEAPPSAAATGTIRLAEKEVQRRTALVAEQEMRLREADALFAKHKAQEALAIYSDVFDTLPNVPLAKPARDHALDGYVRAGTDRATELMNAGNYSDAAKILDALDSPAVAKGNKIVAKTRARMQDPDRYPPALTPHHVEKVSQVQKLLLEANSARELGDYDKALEIFHDVLRVDPYNTAARRGLEKTEQDRSRYFEAARDHQRSKMLNGVNQLWEDHVPAQRADISSLFGGSGQQAEPAYKRTGREAITALLRNLRIQRIDFSGATLDEVLEYLKVRARDLDPAHKGIDFVVSMPPDAARRPITLNLTDVPIEDVLHYVGEMTGTAYRVEDFAVRIVSLTNDVGTIISKTYRVPPDFISGAPVDTAAPTGAAASADPFAPKGANAGGGATVLQIRRLGAKEFLESRGVTFPEGTAATYTPGNNTLVVRNNQRNIEIVDMLVDQAVNNSPKQVVVEVRILDVNQTKLNELGFDWLLGNHGVSGDRAFIGGGAQGNQQNGNYQTPQNFPAQAGLGALAPITAGLRSTGDLNRASVEALIEGATVAGTNRSPGQFSISGVFTDPQFQTVIHALDQKKGVDLMAQPSVVTKSGQKASIVIAREFIYPTEFDPPQVPTNAGSNTTVTPATPTAFSMRNVGATLDVEPVISEDGRTIDVTLTPTITDFIGFVNYGSPILSIDATGAIPVELTSNDIIQPIFANRKIATSVKIWDGATVALGGLVTDENVMIEDKVPVAGSLPFVGRFFRNKVSQRKVKNLIFFVTVKTIDPSGARVHHEAQ